MSSIYKIVIVSSLEIRKEVSKPSRSFLKRGTILKTTGKTKQYRKEIWCEVETLDGIIIKGYVLQKYIQNLKGGVKIWVGEKLDYCRIL